MAGRVSVNSAQKGPEVRVRVRGRVRGRGRVTSEDGG